MWKLAFIVVSLQIYLIKILQKCSLSSPLPNMYMIFFSKLLNLIGSGDWLPWQQYVEFAKKILKNHLLRSHKVDEAETLQKCS